MDKDKEREATRERVRRHRARKKQAPPIGIIAKDTDTNYRLIYWGGCWIKVII